MKGESSCQCHSFTVIAWYFTSTQFDKDSTYHFEAVLYEQCILVSVTICLIIWAIFLRCKTKYSEQPLNKLSLKPFFYLCVALFVRLVDVFVKIFLLAWWICVFESCSQTDNKYEKLFQLNFLNVVNLLVTWMSWVSFALFGGSLCAEHWFYWNFVTFQKKYPQNELDAKKSKFQQRE